MKRSLFLFCFFCVTAAYADESKSFVYNENGKRDPFWPLISASGTQISYDSDMTTATDMTLEGIVVDARKNNLAILNGKIVKAGDQLGLYTVETITNDQVDLIKGTEHLVVKLKKGGV